MRIYLYSQTTGYEILTWSDDEGYEALGRLNGKPKAKKWKPIRVKRIRATRREGCKPSDAPYVFKPGTMVFRRSAVDALRDILDAHGELLPLEDEGGVELYAYNPRALDALDQVQSQGWRDNKGQLMFVNIHVFFPPVVEGVDIFRQVVTNVGMIYVGERFVQRWKQAKLKGLDFTLAWDSDLPPEQQPNVGTAKPIKL